MGLRVKSFGNAFEGRGKGHSNMSLAGRYFKVSQDYQGATAKSLKKN